MKYIIVRIKNEVKVIFQDEFMDHNEFRTQNTIIEVLKLLRIEDFNVELCFKDIKNNED